MEFYGLLIPSAFQILPPPSNPDKVNYERANEIALKVYFAGQNPTLRDFLAHETIFHAFEVNIIIYTRNLLKLFSLDSREFLNLNSIPYGISIPAMLR